MISDQTRRLKSREVSSRYLSPTISSPDNNNTLLSTKQKHKHTGFIRGLWPSSAGRNENQPNTNTINTLAHHLGNEKQRKAKSSSFLSKQFSSSEFRNTNNKLTSKLMKEEYKSPSMRYSSGRSSINSSVSSSSDIFDSSSNQADVILPGRLSVDENALRKRSSYYQMRSSDDNFPESSHHFDSPLTTIQRNSYMAPTLSSIKNINSLKKSASVKRASSPLILPEWESSPSRFGLGSPLFSVSSSNKLPPSNKGKKNLLHMGLDLIKGKKLGGSKLRSSSGSSDMSMGNFHQLRLLQNSWMQWRYANAKAQDVNQHFAAQCQLELLYARESMAKLQQSVVQKRLHLQKKKLEMKLNIIVDSQINMLECWGNIERRHMGDISVMKDYLHAVVCMVPLIQGAKVDLESATIAFRQTSHLVATTKSMLSTFSPMAHDMLSELADVATQEKLLLEECFEHIRIISMLEIQERNLRCSIIAMDSLYDEY